MVKVVFDDGTIARHAEVVVYDENDKEIERGDVDGDGKFSYSPEDAKLLVADDGFGHRAEYVVGEEPYKALPRVPTIAIVLAFAVFSCYLFVLKGIQIRGRSFCKRSIKIQHFRPFKMQHLATVFAAFLVAVFDVFYFTANRISLLVNII